MGSVFSQCSGAFTGIRTAYLHTPVERKSCVRSYPFLPESYRRIECPVLTEFVRAGLSLQSFKDPMCGVAVRRLEV